MRKIYFSFLVLAMAMVSMVAKAADYEFKASCGPNSEDWVIDQAYFPAAEIAEKLGLADAAALYELVGTNTAVYLQLADGSMTNEGFSDPNQPWMNANAEISAYGAEGTCWFAGIGAEDDADSIPSINVWVGQMPGYFKKIYTDSDLKATFYIVNGDAKVSFELSLHVDAAVEIQMPTPTTSLSALNIVKNYEVEIPLMVGKQYEGKTITATLEGIYEALGADAAALDATVADYTYTPTIKTDTIPGATEDAEDTYSYSWNDELAIPAKAVTDAWFGRYVNYDEAADKEVIFGNAPKPWGANGTFYIQKIALADGEFSFTAGQYPGTLKVGDADYANLYIINGDKAACVKVYVNVTAPEVADFANMTQVGETMEIEVPIVTNSADYDAKNFKVDFDAVAEALGCDPADMVFKAFSGENELSDNYNTNGTGFWTNKESGFIAGWGSGCGFYIDYHLSNGYYEIGHFPSAYTDEDVNNPSGINVFLTYGDKYYKFYIKAVVGEKEVVDDNAYKCVAQEGYIAQIQPNSDYTTIQNEDGSWTNLVLDLDIDHITELIGDDITFYGEQVAVVDGDSVATWCDAYSCDPKPGFWMGETEFQNHVMCSTWGSGNSFGYSYANGKLTFFQIPDRHQAGYSATTLFYLVNETTKQYIKYTLNVQYVEEIKQLAETVGSEDVNVNVTDALFNKDGVMEIKLDLAKGLEAMGITEEILEAASVVAPISTIIYNSQNFEEDFMYAKNGFLVNNDADTELMANLAADGTVTIDPMEMTFAAGSEDAASVRIGIEYDGKRYVYVVNLTAPGATIGATDNSAGWWTAFSDFSTLEAGKYAHVTFKNFSDKAENWNNWVLVAQKAGNTTYGAGSDEYFALRVDNYGWGNFYGTPSCDYNWDTFKDDMDGSDVELEISLSEAQEIVVKATITTVDNKVYNYSYTSKSIGADSFNFFFTVEKAHLEDYKVSIDETSAIIAAPAAQTVKSGKFMENGKVVIYNNGKKYNVAGQLIK
ncbi:MAG: DUF4859 domain-containing protein [Prevotellaceae bacterium]|nr:DUF4859 domain-containing protein [Candidatus Minthosoma equi]